MRSKVSRSVEREKVVEVARSWLGTPFHHQARTKGLGVDCAGLVVKVAEELGIVVEDDPRLEYSRLPQVGMKLYRTCQEGLRELGIMWPPPLGSILLFWIRRFDVPQHLAFYVGEGKILHAWSEAGEVVEVNLGPYWQRRVYAIFDYPLARGV